MPKPFDAVSAKNAAQIAAIVHKMPPEVVGLRFVGGWRRRRFVIANVAAVRDDHVAAIDAVVVFGLHSRTQKLRCRNDPAFANRVLRCRKGARPRNTLRGPGPSRGAVRPPGPLAR